MSITKYNLISVLALGLMLTATAFAQEDDKTKKGGDVRKEEAPKHKEKYAHEYAHSFKTDKELDPLYHWHGLEPQGCLEFDPTGLLIRLPEGHPGKRMGTGIGINTPIQGDFEITLRYEMIKEPVVADAGQGTGLFLWVDLNNKGLNRGYLSREIRKGKQYVVWYHLTRGDGQKPIDFLRPFPANDTSGRLRLVRTGATLYHYASEGANGEFTLIHQHSFAADEVQAVRWGGTTGGPKSSLEGRFIDLSIRADELPDLQRNVVAAPAKQEAVLGVVAAPRRPVWLIAVLAVGAIVLLALICVGVLVLFLRRKRD